MLRSLEGREVFREFLRSEYSEDNLLFWLACEDLKKETDSALVDEKARIIYEDYVSILSPKEVFSEKNQKKNPTLFKHHPAATGCFYIQLLLLLLGRHLVVTGWLTSSRLL